MLPAVKAALESEGGPTIASVTVRECRGGYARVGAAPGPAQTPGAAYETEQVFLRGQGDTWEVVDYGTGIGCGDTDLSQDLVAACEALGLR